MIHPILNIFKKQGHLSSILFITLLWFIYFYKFFLFQNTLYLGDSFAFDLHHRVFLINQLKNGEIPLWNPLILNGVPFLLIASQGLLNPATLLFFIFSPPLAMTLATVLNILLAGIMMYFFIFLLTKKYRVSLFAGLVYMFCGLSSLSTTAIVIVQELPLIPLAFITIHLLAVKKQKLYLLLTSLVLALQFISGFPFVPYLTALGITIYYFLENKETFIKKIFNLSLIAVFTIGFSAFLLLPQLEVAKYSTRPAANYAYATSSSLSPFSLPTFIFPHFFGIGEIEIGFNTHNRTYLGVLPLFITLLMIFRKRSLLNKGLLIITVLGFLLSFGRYLPLYRLALFVPGLSNFREPEFFLIWYVFGASYISGVGLDWLVTNKNIFRKLPVKLLFLGFICLSILLICLKLAPPALWQDLITFVQRVIFPGKNLTILLAKAGKIQQLIFLNLENILFVFLIFLVVFIFLRKIKNRKLLFVSLVSLTFFDLMIINQSELFFLKKSEYQRLYTPPHIPETIKNDNFRIHSISHYLPPDWNNFSREIHLKRQIFRDVNAFWPNRNLSYAVASVDGFSPLILKSYTYFLSNQPEKNISGITNYDIQNTSEQLAKAGAKFIITDKLIEEYQPPRYQLLEANPPYYFLYEDTTARKRTFLLNKEGKEIGLTNITVSQANSVTISIESSENASLVLLDTYYPGWNAYVDGVKTPVLPFEKTFRQIDLQPGTHVVNFIFQPQSFYRGILITITTIIFIVLYGIYRFYKHL